MVKKRKIKLTIFFSIIISLFFFTFYYIDRTSHLDGNVTQTILRALYTPQYNEEILCGGY